MAKITWGTRISKMEMLKAYIETGTVEAMYEQLGVSHSKARRRRFQKLVSDGYLQYDNQRQTYKATEKAEAAIRQ